MKMLRPLVLLAAMCLALLAPLHAHAGNGTDGLVTEDGSGAGPGSSDGDGGAGNGSEGPAGVSMPRVMLTEFVSAPNEVTAGEAVTVSFTLQNMSRTTRVNNLRVTLASDDAGAFLPVTGSASTYVSTIRAEGSVSREMTLRTMPGLEEKPYALTLRIEYEDAQANAFESTEQVAIVVRQTVRADTSTPQVMPEEVMAGQQASVTFSINNLGRNKLFNARVTVPEGQGLAPQEVFVGTVEPGASGAVDMTVQSLEETSGPVVVQVSYEDANGVVTTLDKELALAVQPEMLPEEEFPMEEEYPLEEEAGMLGGLPAGVVAVGAGVVVLLLALVLLLVGRSRQRRRAREKDSDMALLDGDPLVPTDLT